MYAAANISFLHHFMRLAMKGSLHFFLNFIERSRDDAQLFLRYVLSTKFFPHSLSSLPHHAHLVTGVFMTNRRQL